jgi:hypothetical protein
MVWGTSIKPPPGNKFESTLYHVNNLDDIADMIPPVGTLVALYGVKPNGQYYMHFVQLNPT